MDTHPPVGAPAVRAEATIVENRREGGANHRLLLLGDSFVEGMGFSYGDTFAGRLAHELKAEGIEVLNGGTRSHSPKLYYLKLRYLTEVRGFKFDEVYVFVDISDIQDEIVY